MNILITGATGFLGSHLLRHLFYTTDFKFIVLKRPLSSLAKISDILAENASRIIFVDVLEDWSNLDSIFETYSIRAIIHCATNYGRNNASCISVLETNLIFPIKLIESAIKHNVELFINTDSYFNKPNFSYMYLQNYSLSKKSLRMWLRYFSCQIKIANMVLEHIYGENDSFVKFTSFLVSEIAIKKSPVIDLTYGDQKRDFIYIKDVVEAYKTVLLFYLSHPLHYQEIEVGTGHATSVKDFALTVKTLSHSPTQINFGAIKYRTDEIFLSVADNSLLSNLGWHANFTVERGIEEFIKNEQAIIHCNSNLQ